MRRDLINYGPLQVDEDLALQRQEWRAARVLWLLMVAVVVAALLGVFGHGGPLAERTIRGDGLRLHLAAFARYGATTEVIVTAEGDGCRELIISQAYLDAYSLESVLPRPIEMAALDNRLQLRFANAATQVRLRLLPQRRGSQSGWLSADGGARLALRQFIYP